MPNFDLDLDLNFDRGERWLQHVFPFEPALRAALSKSLTAERADGVGDSRDAAAQPRVEELLLETYARILTAASEPTFTPVCLKSFALNTAREVAGISVAEPDVDDADDLELVIAIARDLPRTTRQVFTLRKVYDCSILEIASRLNLSPADVESHLITAARTCTQQLFARPTVSPATP